MTNYQFGLSLSILLVSTLVILYVLPYIYYYIRRRNVNYGIEQVKAVYRQQLDEQKSKNADTKAIIYNKRLEIIPQMDIYIAKYEVEAIRKTIFEDTYPIEYIERIIEILVDYEEYESCQYLRDKFNLNETA